MIVNLYCVCVHTCVFIYKFVHMSAVAEEAEEMLDLLSWSYL